MKYFLDTEFHEYHKQPKVCGIKIGKTISTIDLISIGIVNDGKELSALTKMCGPYGNNSYIGKELLKGTTEREYYAVCKDFNIKDAWNANQGTKEKPNYWLRENVLRPIYFELLKLDGDTYNNIYTKELGKYEYKIFKRLINKYGKTKEQIAEEIKEFVGVSKDLEEAERIYSKNKTLITKKWEDIVDILKPEFYAYYADYDWVVFCQLFGKMIDLPTGFPMYCKDLKQSLDENWGFKSDYKKARLHPNYPKQENEHNALDDAKWNKKLYNFLNTL